MAMWVLRYTRVAILMVIGGAAGRRPETTAQAINAAARVGLRIDTREEPFYLQNAGLFVCGAAHALLHLEARVRCSKRTVVRGPSVP
jgi:hypothetical protein